MQESCDVPRGAPVRDVVCVQPGERHALMKPALNFFGKLALAVTLVVTALLVTARPQTKAI